MLYWVVRPWRQAFDFRQRATRREYWFFIVQLYVVFFLALFVLGLVQSLALPGQAVADAAGAMTAVITSIPLLALVIPYLSASVRRLHDHDKTGWLFLLAFVPVVGWIFFLIMMLTPGTQGANGYGADPRDRLDSTEDVSEVFS